MRSCWTLKEIAPAHELTNWSVSQIRRRSGSKFKQLERINLLIYWFLLKWLFLLPKRSFVRLNTLEHDVAAAGGGNDNSIFDQLFWHQTIFTMGEWDNEGDLWNCPQLAACGNDNTQLVEMGLEARWRYRVCRQKRGCLLPSKQSATTPKCYHTRVLRHQSATSAPKWCHQHDALLVAHRSMGGGWRNTKGLREEMEMVILKKYKRWFGRNTNTGGTGN